jgi:hypothetical protein
MKRAFLFGLLIASSAHAAGATGLDEDGLVKQIAHGILASDKAVACQLRRPEWREAVLMGWVATARLALMSANPETTDENLDAKAATLLRAAKVQAALDAQFAAPTQEECAGLNTSQDMQEMDAAAKIGLAFGAAQ